VKDASRVGRPAERQATFAFAVYEPKYVLQMVPHGADALGRSWRTPLRVDAPVPGARRYSHGSWITATTSRGAKASAINMSAKPRYGNMVTESVWEEVRGTYAHVRRHVE
jgi:hypothetical protein